MGVFVWPFAKATTSKGGDAGENRPVASSRWRLALCPDMNTALPGSITCRRALEEMLQACRDGGEEAGDARLASSGGSTAAASVDGPLGDAHAMGTAVRAGVLGRHKGRWDWRDGVRGGW